jgi:outer membrane murein-binding lipoprotein Lpp
MTEDDRTEVLHLRAEVQQLQEDNEEFRARLAAAYQEIEQLRQRLVDVIGTSGVATPG